MNRPLRIVVAHETWFGSTGFGIVHGLRRLGADVHEIDFRLFTFEPSGLMLRAAYRALRSARRRAYNDAVVDAVARIRPDAFLAIKGSWLRPETLRAISAHGATTLNYYPDVYLRSREVDAGTIPLYDRFITTKSFQIETLERMLGPGRVEFLHHGYCDAVHVPPFAAMEEEDYTADVTYVGNYTPYKERWLAALARGLPDATLRIAGQRWENARDPLLRKAIVGHELKGSFYARAIQTSRINIAVHMGALEPGGWEDLVSTRSFEIPACRGFMLHIDNAEIRALFEVGREIDVFSGEAEMVEKVTHYLAHPEERRKMAELAYRRCVPAYGYDARAEVIARRIAELREARSG